MRETHLTRHIEDLFQHEDRETITMVELLEIRNQRQLRTMIQDFAVITGEDPSTCSVLLSASGSTLATLQALVRLWERAYPEADLPSKPKACLSAFAPWVEAAGGDSR